MNDGGLIRARCHGRQSSKGVRAFSERASPRLIRGKWARSRSEYTEAEAGISFAKALGVAIERPPAPAEGRRSGLRAERSIEAKARSLGSVVEFEGFEGDWIVFGGFHRSGDHLVELPVVPDPFVRRGMA